MSTGYKGFDKDLKCNGMQYEVGKEFTVEGEIIPCENGLHFCENPFDVFGYYSPANSRFCEVESKGKEVNKDNKKVTDRLYVKAEIGLQGIINAGVKFILDKVKWDNTPATNTGYYSAAIVEGNQSIAMATGFKSKAKGKIGCWLVLAEWDKESINIIDVQCAKIDGVKIKPDTFYCLKNGKFIEE